MTPRERVQRVLRRELPDSVPRALYGVAINAYNDSTLELFERRMGKHPRDCFRHDVRGVGTTSRTVTEDWTRAVRDIASVDDVARLMDDWTPSATDAADLQARIDAEHRAGRAVMCIGTVSDFETPFSLRGREQFFLDLGYEEEWLGAFLDRLADAGAADAGVAARAGADIFGIGDDLGSQRGLLLSPVQWRRLFKPRLKRIIDGVKNVNPDVAFFLHTDGLVAELIPDFIEIGVDILNPIQPEVMDPAQVKADYGDELIFFGAISVQHTLPFGSAADVAAEVKLRMETIGAGGGYIMTPSHLVNADIPWENIVAFFDAADRYGSY